MVTCEPLITDPSICNFLVGTILPWIFSFAIVYGLVLRSKVFGEASDAVARGISGIIGAVAAFLVTMAAGPSIGNFLTTISGSVVMYAAVILGIVMLFAIVNPELLRKYEGGKGLALIVCIIAVAGLVISYLTPGATPLRISQDLIVLIITLIVIAGVVWFAVGLEGKKEEQQGGKSGE